MLFMFDFELRYYHFVSYRIWDLEFLFRNKTLMKSPPSPKTWMLHLKLIVDKTASAEAGFAHIIRQGSKRELITLQFL